MNKIADFKKYALYFLEEWNTQDVERVLNCYTPDVIYTDPNTRGDITGHERMRPYLKKLFAGWKMHWSLREVHPFNDSYGAAVLWHATFEKEGKIQQVECNGMDFVLLDGDKIKKNEVYFDKSVLTPLL